MSSSLKSGARLVYGGGSNRRTNVCPANPDDPSVFQVVVGWLTFALAMSLTGCVTNSPEVQSVPAPSVLELVNIDLLGQAEFTLDEQQIFSLTPTQSKHFLDYFHREDLADEAPHWRVHNYVERFADKFDYLGATHTARNAMAKQEGNCLSLSIVTTALARLAGVRVGYQLIDSVPVYERKGDLVFKGQHVRTLLHHEEHKKIDGGVAYTGSTLVVDYFPDKNDRVTRRIKATEYVSMYYRNLAADALADADLQLAFTYAMAAAEYAPADESVVNVLALIHHRAGDVQTAEKIYRFGIEHSDSHLTLLNNYRSLLRTQDREQEAERISAQISDYDDQQPFHWLGLAHARYLSRDWREAERFYRRALDLAPYLHEAHFGLARVQYRRGERRAARISLDRALQQARDLESKGLYQAKLEALER